MMTQYTIIAIILAACILYAAFCLYQSWRKLSQCHDRNYQCAGCVFHEQCKRRRKGFSPKEYNIKKHVLSQKSEWQSEKNKDFPKKSKERFGGTKKI